MSIPAQAKMLAKDARSLRENHASKFIAMTRRFAQIPGLTRAAAQKLAMENFPGSYADYVRRQNLGEKLPVIFQSADFDRRKSFAAANSGRLP